MIHSRKRIFHAAAAIMLLAAQSSCGNAGTEPALMPALEGLAKGGNAEAIYHIGMAYQTGSGVPQDHAKALEAFRRAAALGDPLAAYKLGCYYDGQDEALVRRDPQLALKYKLVAANAGYALAQQDVAALYAEGGAPQTAVPWLEKAAAQGWPDSLAGMASVYNGAPGISPDAAKTAAYFRLYLDRGKADARQLEWLKSFDAELTQADRARADTIVRTYHAQPTALTLKGLSGQRAAVELVARSQ